MLHANGGRGRIRTSVARKERQIYSLLVLATHPPVRTGALIEIERAVSIRRETPRSSVLFTQETVCPFLSEIRRPNTATIPKSAGGGI